MRFLVSLVIFLSSTAALGSAPLSAYCHKLIDEDVKEFQLIETKLRNGKLTQVAFDGERSSILLSVHQGAFDCAEEMGAEDRDAAAEEFTNRFHSRISPDQGRAGGAR